jgi:predicted GH43/DUF377 family glycosyl hydrolase
MIKLKRYPNNPILKPNPQNQWESKAVFNPGACYKNGKIYLLYRAVGEYKNYISRLGLAVSKDGFHFERVSDKPVFQPEADYEKWGCEDPTINLVEKKTYITYVVLDQPARNPKKLVQTALAKTTDFRNFQRMGVITPKFSDNRDVVFFPEKIKGKYIMLHRPKRWIGEKYKTTIPSVWVAYSKNLLDWSDHQLLYQPTETWESIKIGAGPPPIKTSLGWLLIYHGIGPNMNPGLIRFDKGIQTRIYRAGALLLDLNNPTKIIGRSKKPILEPEKDYEINGDVPNVVFPTGNFVKNGQLFVYYGAADKTCCLATVSLNKLIKDLLKNA